MSLPFSPYQTAIFNFVEHGTGHAVIEAVAGSGKTTTIVEAIKRTTGSSVFLAFNKSIATELVARGVNAKTFHSLCYSPVTRAVGTKTVNQYKLRELVAANFDERDQRLYGAFAAKLVGLARGEGFGALVEAGFASVWEDLAEKHGLEPESDLAELPEGIAAARRLLELSNASKQVDFDDLLYLAVRNRITLPKFDWVFVDEAQDTNAVQRALLQKILTPAGRLVAVGDPAQAIYGFRGADSESLANLKSQFHATTLPLSVSYRCAQAIVAEARKHYPVIEAAPTAPDGAVRNLNLQWSNKDFASSDLVVCRNTKPLIGLAYSLLRDRIPCKVLGREIGEGLKRLVNRMQAKGLDALVTKLAAYAEREVAKAKNEAAAEAISDRVETLTLLAHELPENKRTIPDLLDVLDQLFNGPAGACVLLATIHKAKGLEADRVWWLNPSLCPSRWARQPWQLQQEVNLQYVAVTRAKRELFLIEQPK